MHTPYRDYRLRLRLLSALGTPMQSDTLFGHLAWHVAWTQGPEGVRRFLAPFLDGQPPFILSDAFPADCLPRPLFPAAANEGRTTRADYAAHKKRNKAPYISMVESKDALWSGVPVASPWTTVETPHASIDRNTWTTTPNGQFFHTTAQTLRAQDGAPAPLLDIYLRTIPDTLESVLEGFRHLSQLGFGRDKSVGLGAFEIVDYTPWERFQALDGANAFVSLATYMPARHDPTHGYWRLRVKRGYLGEHAGAGNPFKRPMLQIEPGAVFRAPEGVHPFYGRMVGNIAPGMPEAIQCGYTIAVPCPWPRVDATLAPSEAAGEGKSPSRTKAESRP